MWVFLNWYICGFLFMFFLSLMPHSDFVWYNYIEYIMIFRGLVCLVVTGIIPIKKSYTANAIIPFPINEECIKSLEMALLMPTSANYFYNYLENFADDKDALIYFGLYADIRQYLRMSED